MACALASSAMVRADFLVGTVAATGKLSGAFAWTTVRFPSPVEANARFVSGSKALALTPSPMGTVATIFPESASMTAIILLPQPANSRRVFQLAARPEGSSHGAIGQR